MAQATTATRIEPVHVHIPGHAGPFSLALPPEIATLRERALEAQRESDTLVVELTLAEAKAWAAHTPDEDWLVWRARRTAARLDAMPVDLEPGECLVGKPLFRQPNLAEKAALTRAQATLSDMPPFPGGDAGHFHPDYVKLFQVGLGGLAKEIRQRSQSTDLDPNQQALYRACEIALQSVERFAQRLAANCAKMATMDPADGERWQQMSRICQHVASEPPTTMHEALQLLFLTEIALWFGEGHHLTSPGRLDQTLRPFYDADMAAGRITPREAFELICCLYIQMNRILHPGSAISVLLGGRDRQGQDVTNTLTYLCLAARQATQLVYPTVGLAWHPDTPTELMDYAMRMLVTGIGDPAFFNDPLIVTGLRDHGVSESDAYDYMNSTCVEIKVVGASNMWVTQPYYNLAGELLTVMAEAIDNPTTAPATMEAFKARLGERLAQTIGQGAQRLDRIWRQRSETGGFPLASCFIDDCLARAKDFDRGGARYNWVENSFVGLANLVDSLIAIETLVYTQRTLSLSAFYHILQADFEGHETLRQRIVNRLPKYGNHDQQADQVAQEWATFLIDTTETNHVGPHRYVPGFFCWIKHEQLGRETDATPDGRLARQPLADGAGAAQGREKQGPTASALSTTTWSHRKALGGLVHNAKFARSMMLNTPDSLRAVRSVIETYLRQGGFEIQVNVLDRATLLQAQAHPERFPDLLVRVAGYSDYFVHLNRNMQKEIIDRTTHSL